MGTDLRHAMRGLLRAPTLTAAAILCLGLGIGATTAIFTAVHAALLRPLPFPQPDGLVSVFRTTPHFDSGPFSAPNFLDLRRGTRALAGLAAATPGGGLLQVGERSARVTSTRVSGDFFPLLGVSPLHGRTLGPGDEDPGQPPVALLSHGLWREQFAADPALVGRSVRLDGVEHEVVGILPPGFRVPHGFRVFSPDVWVPLRITPQQAGQRRSNYLVLMGRLRPGTGVAAAEADLKGLMDGIVEAHPELSGEHLRVSPLHDESVRAVRGPLTLLLGAVAFVLLIAAANVASLLLARGVARRGEWAVRTALGAARWDVLRPALLESAVLTGAGLLLGVGLAWAGVRLIESRVVAAGLPQLQGLAMDGAVLAFSIALGVAVAFTCGVAPAWQAQRADPQQALRAEGRGGAGGHHHRFLRGLVMVEVALSLVLLVGAGLVVRGFQELVARDPGFDPAPLLTLTVDVPADDYPDGTSVERFLLPALEAVRGTSGVRQAAFISLIPYTNWGWNFNIRYEGQPGDDPTRLPLTENRVVTPSFFETVGQPLLRGRLLTAADGDPDQPPVVVVNRALAERDFPGGDVLGKRFHTGDTTFATIVGVVADIRNFGPDSDPRPEVYWSAARSARGASSFPLMVRVRGDDPMAHAREVTAAIHSVHPAAAVSDVRTMDQVIAGSVGRPRFYLTLLSAFAGVALVLAMAGLYGVMSYTVAQRRREIGIRAALGSTPGATTALVLSSGMRVIALGAVAGLAGGWALTRFLEGMLYGVSPVDPATWAGVTALLVLAGGSALLLPARRAARVQPVVAMRE